MYYEELMSYFQSRFNSIESNFLIASKQNDPEGIHDLRVELKRMRAFFNFVEAVNTDFHAREKFKQFRKISKYSSRLRDIRVQRDLLSEISNTHGKEAGYYKEYLAARESEYYSSFQVFSEGYPLKKLFNRGRDIIVSLKTVNPIWAKTKALGRFYNLRNDIIILVNQCKKKEYDLHKIRIIAKEFHYCFEIIQQCLFLFPGNSDFVDKISKVHKLLGKWHDYEVGIGLLKEYLNINDVKRDNKETLMQLIQIMLQEKKGIRKAFQPAFEFFKQSAIIM